MRKTNLLGATFLALATSAWSIGAVAQAPKPAPTPAPTAAPAPETAPAPEPAPAPDTAPAAEATPPAKKKPMHHKTVHAEGKLAPTKAGDKAVEDLNDASLSAAKSGKPFVAPTTPEAAKKTAHEPAKKMKHVGKKKAPAADSPPADTSK